jgi:hypothetical protein
MEAAGLVALVGCAITLFAKAISGPRQPRIIVFGPSDSPYTAGLRSILDDLSPREQVRLLKADKLFERFFDCSVRDATKNRAVQDCLDDAMCVSRDLNLVETDLIQALREAAGSELNLKAGLIATAEMMLLLRKVSKLRSATRSFVWSSSLSEAAGSY